MLIRLGHCRKRKIRCQPAADPKGMCTMCVKLNKQCTYFPIEQPAVQDTKARPQENCDPEMTDSFVSSVSPHLKIEDLGQGHNFSQITAVPINMCREYGYDPENANVPSTAEGECYPFSSFGNETDNANAMPGFPPLQHSVSWDSQTYRAFPAIAEDVPQDYAVQQEQWKTTDTLVNHNIHQHYSRPPIEYQQPNIVPATHNATPRNEMGWMGAAQRTTSMNGNEAAYANYHQNTANHSAPMHDNTRRSSTTSYPSSLSVAEHSSTPSSNDSIPPLIAAPASGTHGLPSQYAYNPHYHPYAIQHQQAIPESMQPLDGYGYQTTTAWYTDTNHHRY